MRKAIIFCIAVLLLVPAFLNAQPEYPTDKGSMLIGGTAYFTSSGGDARGNNRFNVLSTKIMYFIAQNLAFGGNFLFMNQSWGDDSQTSIGIGPVIIYYLGEPDRKTLPFIGSSFTYANLSDAYSQIIISVNGGVTFMIARNVGITGEAVFQFENFSPEGGGDSKTGNSFGIAFGVTAFIY